MTCCGYFSVLSRIFYICWTCVTSKDEFVFLTQQCLQLHLVKGFVSITPWWINYPCSVPDDSELPILFISVSPVVILTPWSWELPRVQCSVPYFQVLPHQTLACFSNSSAPSMLGISYSESLSFHLMVSVSDLASLLHSITLGPSYFINKILILHFLLVLFYNYRSWCSISLTDDSH